MTTIQESLEEQLTSESFQKSPRSGKSWSNGKLLNGLAKELRREEQRVRRRNALEGRALDMDYGRVLDDYLGYASAAHDQSVDPKKRPLLEEFLQGYQAWKRKYDSDARGFQQDTIERYLEEEFWGASLCIGFAAATVGIIVAVEGGPAGAYAFGGVEALVFGWPLLGYALGRPILAAKRARALSFLKKDTRFLLDRYDEMAGAR
ncbi:hypothetical protein J4439_00365 [Candidatus Woesearchaeota archaeon]|nr:hypothetical protein [Candidatus Woesearchaeota archaeon]